jgi:DNA polymerase III delta subunit
MGGASTQEAAKAAGVPAFRVRDFERQLGLYRGDELLKALDRLAKADQGLKGSKLPPGIIFESMILDLCAG